MQHVAGERRPNSAFLTLVENPLSQMVHLKGLSLVCERIWISRAELQAKTLKQI